jgi:2-polyprenyl-3-methyl-5-hydroxy-6-metoxy-1,4-benzoquinol methylase
MSFLNTTKHYIKDLFKYLPYHDRTEDYQTYWQSRGFTNFNAFQRARAGILKDLLGSHDSVLDVGCGSGAILGYLKEEGLKGRYVGMDIFDGALEAVRQRGLEAIKADTSRPEQIPDPGMFDYVTLFEILEHMPDSEALLAWALAHAKKGVVFTVPNTGFIMYRLRLLFGRFPLQWRAHPSEHVRFWTMRDMRWWLDQLRYKEATVTGYVGIPFLNKLRPSLFSAGLFVVIQKQR